VSSETFIITLMLPASAVGHADAWKLALVSEMFQQMGGVVPVLDASSIAASGVASSPEVAPELRNAHPASKTVQAKRMVLTLCRLKSQLSNEFRRLGKAKLTIDGTPERRRDVSARS
jgi:hypothetical protein